MGNYISEGTLYTRIGTARLTGLCRASGNEDASAVLSGAVARAEAMVNSYAAVRYAIPLAGSDLLAEWSFRIAEYELYKRSPGDSIPQKIKDAYQDVIVQLKALAEGTIKIPSASSGSSGGGSSGGSGGSSGSGGSGGSGGSSSTSTTVASILISPLEVSNGGMQIFDSSSMESF